MKIKQKKLNLHNHHKKIIKVRIISITHICLDEGIRKMVFLIFFIYFL